MRKKRISRARIGSTFYYYLIDNKKSITYAPGNFLERLEEEREFNITDFNPYIKEDVETVKSDFEQIAVMQKNGLIDENAYFDAYWGSMLRFLPPLYGHIRKSQIDSGTQHFTVYWPEQCKRAVEYWQKNFSTSTINYFSWSPSDDPKMKEFHLTRARRKEGVVF